jgi:Ca2+-binding EF-hand superfamily protein
MPLLAAHSFIAVAAELGPEPPAASREGDPVDVLYFGADRPLVIRVYVLVDGLGFRAAWTSYVEQLFARLDADGDGELNLTEARAIPAADAFVDGNGRDAGGAPLRNENIDVDPPDDRITWREFSSHFARIGGAAVATNIVGPAVVSGAYSVQGMAASDSRLLDYLDTDKNGALSTAELSEARHSLALFDLDDDGTFNRSELAPLGDPFGRMRQQQRSQQSAESLPFVLLSVDSSAAAVVRRLLERFDQPEAPHDGAPGDGEPIKDHRLSRDEFALPAGQFDRCDVDGDGLLDFEELSYFVSRPHPDLELTTRLGERRPDQQPAEAVGAAQPAETAIGGAAVRFSGDGLATVVLGSVQIDIACQPGSDGPAAARVAYLEQFKAADKDRNGYLEPAELAENPLARDTFALLDSDGDGKLFEAEALAWFDQRETSARSRVVLTISDQGRDLFEILDVNHDGRLSPRELAAAVHRFPLWDAEGDGELDAEEIPNHYRLAFGRGQSALPALAPGAATSAASGGPALNAPPPGPSWFQKMDRNRDGEIAPREFLGAPALFKRLDSNSDGILDAAEAAAAR